MSGGERAPGRMSVELLAGGELGVAGFLAGASNGTLLGTVSADGRTVPVVYKPRDGEAPLWDFPDGTLAAREVAAYRLSLALGWPRIPPTVFRDGPMGAGSVQLFVRADPNEHFFTLRRSRLEEFRPVAAFDVLANNADRKGGHCLLDSDGLIWVIDHGLCFNAAPKLRTVIWDFAGRELPPSLLADVARVADELRSGGLRRDLLDLLAEEEVEATRRRAEALASAGRLPEPGPGRVVPWPPV